MTLLALVHHANSLSNNQQNACLTAPSASNGYLLLSSSSATDAADGEVKEPSGEVIGMIPPQVVPELCKQAVDSTSPNSSTTAPSIFVVDHNRGSIWFHPALTTSEARSKALADMLAAWRANAVFPSLKGWRNELYVVPTSGGSIHFEIERAAAGLFGVRHYGCHLNGFCTKDGVLKMWIARRSAAKQTYPLMLDNLVGGGLGSGMTPFTTLVKECGEEAGIPESMARTAKAAGAVSFFGDILGRGWIPDTEFVYDLELPPDFLPTPTDGEVEQFYLWDLEEVRKHLLAREFMPEAALVIIDFLVRHGFITAENGPDYLEIVSGLRRPLPMPARHFSQN
ncbi:hypothetical protein HK102_003524 [Quaeritorhiza haematococci]|nr:hypothetical protein HK102_003524 [Quaeritorhiza haematococci]